MREMNIRKEVLNAEKRILKHIRKSPLEYSHELSRIGDSRVFLKLENLQITGSFKLRGAANFILSLAGKEKKKGLVTSSTGNHGAACAHMMKTLGLGGTIYMPENASPAKVNTIRSYGIPIDFFGDDCVKTEIHARKIAEKNGQIYIPPYNHPRIIGGQGTIALELLDQIKIIDFVLVPVGGGGLISGIAGYLKSENPDIEIIGCQPENSPVMAESVRLGKIIDMESRPTLSKGTAGGIEPGSITFDICKEVVNDFILVSEEEIRNAILWTIKQHSILIEGAAALTVAAFLKEKHRFKARTAVLILSGRKIGLETLKSLLCSEE